MTDVGVKYDRSLGTSVMGAFVVVRASFVVVTSLHMRAPSFDLSIGSCQAVEGRSEGLRMSLRRCKYGAKCSLKKVENKLHCHRCGSRDPTGRSVPDGIGGAPCEVRAAGRLELR